LLQFGFQGVKWHRQHIMQKLQAGSLAELVSLAERLDLVGDRDPL